MMPSIFKSNATLAQVNGWGAGTLGENLGIEITEIGLDFLRGRMPVDHRTKQPFGLLHGGASIALAETLGSIAAQLAAGPNFQALGIEINGNHVKSASAGHVIGTARALHICGKTQVWDIRIENEQAELVCVSRLTVALKKREAQAEAEA